jgi:acyl carrier protein
MHPFSAIVTASGAITFTARDGQSYTIARENPRYDEAKEALAQVNQFDLFSTDANEFIDKLVKIAKPVKAIESDSGGKITVREGKVYYRDAEGEEREVHNVVAERIVWLLSEKFDAKAMTLFLERLMENPSYRSVNDVYRFMERNQMGITPDGYLLAYKKVRNDYMDIHSGTYDNHPGESPKMPRNEVEDNPDVTCSHGLHVCAYSYLPKFSGGTGERVVVCKINPRDVVSVPKDYADAKMRVCEYEVLYEVPNYRDRDALAKKPVIAGEHDLHEEEEDDSCPNCGSEFHSNGYCSACGYEDDPADESDDVHHHDVPGNNPEPWRPNHAALHEQHEPEEPPVIEFRDHAGEWKELIGHCCNTQEEAQAYVAALGEGVRIRPAAEAQPEPQPASPAPSAPVDLRKAVDGIGEAATAMYGEGRQVNVELALDGEGGLNASVRPVLDKTDDRDMKRKIKAIIVEHLGVEEDKVTDDARIISDLGADSLDEVELVMAFEEEFGVEVPDDEGDKYSDASVQEITDWMKQKVERPI